MSSVLPEVLKEIETTFREAWTGADSTPFIVDALIPETVRADAEALVKRLSLGVLFIHCPTLAVWAVLTPLSKHYGARTKDVYHHITSSVKDSYSTASDRKVLKREYCIAARKIGLPVSGNDLTDLFFAPLGPPRSRYADLADAFVGTMHNLGRPAVEDTASARDWQRRAVRDRCPNITRLRKAIHFDRSAHCARRFDAWLKGEAPLNDSETALFKAYDCAASRHQRRTRSDLAGPPRIFWTRDRLWLETERSSQPQQIKTGAFPIQISGGSRRAFDPPWKETLRWSYGLTACDVPFGPSEGEVLLFDDESGALLARADIGAGEVEVAATGLVALARQDFDSGSFGDAVPASDRSCRISWIKPGESLSFAEGALSIRKPHETAIWIDGASIGQCGSRPLRTGDGALMIKLDPEIGGKSRIVRARLGEVTKCIPLDDLNADGMARVPFEAFAFDPHSPPSKAVFEVLAPGAAGDFKARGDLSVSDWLWPGLVQPAGALLELPCPENYDPVRSAGLRQDGTRLHIDPQADVEAPVLGLGVGGNVLEFTLRTGAEILRHHRLAHHDKVLIPRGARIRLGYEGRHDTLILQSSDRDADLLVIGRTVRRPFLVSKRFEITAEMLETPSGADDRIALRRKDGRVEIFAHLMRRDDPVDLDIEESDDAITLCLKLQQRCDALRVRVDGIQGEPQEGEYSFGRHPTDRPQLPGISACPDIDTGALTVRVEKALYRVPARLSLWTRKEDRQGFLPLEDAEGVPIAIGLGDPICAPDQRMLGLLASLLAEPVPLALEEQVACSLGLAYQDAMERVGKNHLVGSVRSALTATRKNGGVPRHDIVGVAPWIFEAVPTAYGNLPEDSGLSALERLAAISIVTGVPDPEHDSPLTGWLLRLRTDDELPKDIGPDALRNALGALRCRLKESELRLLLGDGRHGKACTCICSCWVADLEAIRSFDLGGGGDDRPARIAAAIERFARDAALARSEDHLCKLSFRTGLGRNDVGECLTLMLRAGIEVFVYFRALWSQAAQEQKDRR